jgi:hypothetical protein
MVHEPAEYEALLQNIMQSFSFRETFSITTWKELFLHSRIGIESDNLQNLFFSIHLISVVF